MSAKAASVGANPLAPLDLFRDPANLDNVTAGSQREIDRLLAAGYRRVRTEAVVLAEPAPGAAALKLFWNEALGAHQTVATAQGERDAAAAGYIFDGVQGFIWPGPGPGLHPLKQYRSLLTGRLRLIAAPDDEAEAVAQGFVFLRIEGYAPS